jgi:hypothetical protein
MTIVNKGELDINHSVLIMLFVVSKTIKDNYIKSWTFTIRLYI